MKKTTLKIKPGATLYAALLIALIVFALMFFIWPAAVTLSVVCDKKLSTDGMSRLAPRWYKHLAPRFETWARGQIASGAGAKAESENVPATEWPMFGSMFFLATAADLHAAGLIDARAAPFRSALESARDIITSPDTAAWVVEKWGGAYLEKENIFYRMLLIMGLAAYEEATGDSRDRALLASQRALLADEIASSPLCDLDDYPGECWPSDVAWAAAAVNRAARLEGLETHAFTNLVASYEGPLAVNGLPAFKVERGIRDALALHAPRGTGNAHLLAIAHDISSDAASRWFAKFEEDFWQANAWICGFRENARGAAEIEDVDSGPVLWGFGSVASAFGIGAARANGRFDIARPLALEAVAASWPTPFGFLLPRMMGKAALGASPLGEAALIFSMTRPCRVDTPVAAGGYVPRSVWLAILVWLFLGVSFIYIQAARLARLWRRTVYSET